MAKCSGRAFADTAFLPESPGCVRVRSVGLRVFWTRFLKNLSEGAGYVPRREKSVKASSEKSEKRQAEPARKANPWRNENRFRRERSADASASVSEPPAELIPRQKRNATPGLRFSGQGRTEPRELDGGADLLSLRTAHQHN